MICPRRRRHSYWVSLSAVIWWGASRLRSHLTVGGSAPTNRSHSVASYTHTVTDCLYGCKSVRGCFCLNTITALLVQACFALKKISVSRFKSVPMLRYMSCFQLSDGPLFALVHLSASISPPARLPLAPLLPGENAQLMENIIYSCLSPNPRACAAGKRGGRTESKRRAFMHRRQEAEDDSSS